MIQTLSRSLKRRRIDQRGFTLIELLVVIVILGILAAVVVFAVGGIDDRGEQSAISADETTLRTAQEVYCGQNGHYASSNEELVAAGLLSAGSVLHSVLPSFGNCGDGFEGPNGYSVVCVDVACPVSPAPPGDVLLLGASGPAGFPSPFSYNRGGAYTQMFLMYDSLLWKDATGVIPWLATEVPTEANGLRNAAGTEYTFNLRPGVRWHDFATTSETLDADDVKFTFDYYKASIADGEIPGSVIAPPLSTITSVDVIDADTVKFTLSAPAATFLQFGAAGGVPIVPEHIWGPMDYTAPDPADHDSPTFPNPNATPPKNDINMLVGTGPYTMDGPETFANPTNFQYTAFEDYFLGSPLVKKINHTAANGNLAGLDAGTVHLTGLEGPPSVVDPVLSRHTVIKAPPGSGTTALNFNHAVAPFDDVDLRKAIAMTIDRQFLVDQLYGDAGGPGNGLPGNPGFIPPGHPHYEPAAEQYPTNVAAADALLDASGYGVKDTDGIRFLSGNSGLKMVFDLTVPTPTASPPSDLTVFTPLLDSALNRIGIDLNQVIDPALATPVTGSIDSDTVGGMYLIGSGGLNSDLGADYPRLVYRSDATLIQRALNYNNPALDILLNQQAAEPDEAARKEITSDIQLIVADEVPLLHLVYPDSYSAFNADAFDAWFYTPGGLGGVVPTTLNKFALVTGRQGGTPAP